MTIKRLQEHCALHATMHHKSCLSSATCLFSCHNSVVLSGAPGSDEAIWRGTCIFMTSVSGLTWWAQYLAYFFSTRSLPQALNFNSASWFREKNAQLNHWPWTSIWFLYPYLLCCSPQRRSFSDPQKPLRVLLPRKPLCWHLRWIWEWHYSKFQSTTLSPTLPGWKRFRWHCLG